VNESHIAYRAAHTKARPRSSEDKKRHAEAPVRRHKIPDHAQNESGGNFPKLERKLMNVLVARWEPKVPCD
jgi:hypothetical protein